MQFSGQSHYLFQIVSKFPKVKLSVLLPAGVLRHAKQQRYIGHITGLFPVGSSWDGFDLNCVLLSVGEKLTAKHNLGTKIVCSRIQSLAKLQGWRLSDFVLRLPVQVVKFKLSA